MISSHKINELISLTLFLGTMSALVLNVAACVWYLYQHGTEIIQLEPLQNHPTTMTTLWTYLSTPSSAWLMTVGLMILVTTQVLRVGLLAWFYITIRDRWFALFSLFILAVLLYSLIWRI